MKFHVLICLAFASTAVRAQAPYWARDIGGLGTDGLADVKAGADGGLYFTGDFTGAFTFGGVPLTSAGSSDCVVGRVDEAGALVWMKRAGGPSVDRGVKVFPVGDGSVMVIGQFVGTADLFGTTVTSAGNTQDLFVAKLNALTGAAIWVRTAGSATNSDKPFGVSVSVGGNVTVTGAFKGTCSFGTQTLTSMIDPSDGDASFDVFVATYAPDGTLLWVLAGNAEHDDRGIDVVNDAGGNIYVTGQFSDAVTFQQVHPNTMTNASFLLKLDPAGNEMWFRRFGGGQFNEVRDMVISASGELLLCGDLQGTMVYEDDAVHVITAPDLYAYYLLRVGSSGEFLGNAVMGSANSITAASLEQRGDSVAVLGEFKCRFTGLCAQYGQGVFMATGPQDLFVAQHRVSDMAFLNAQQFGGTELKRAGQITSLDNGALVFCGAHEGTLVFPADTGAWEGTQDVFSSNHGITYCGDPFYGVFKGVTSNVLADGFMARAWVPGRRPYDVWLRENNGGCAVPEPDVCVVSGSVTTGHACIDEMHYCIPPPGPAPLFAVLAPYASSTGAYGAGFGIDAVWMDGTIGTVISAGNSTAQYSCAVTTSNGCFSWNPSMQLNVDTYPSFTFHSMSGALITDLIQPLGGTPLVLPLCAGHDSVWVTDISQGNGYTLLWNGTGMPSMGFGISSPGTISIVLDDPEGCGYAVQVDVVSGASAQVPDITGVTGAFIGPGNVPLATNDTVHVCSDAMGCIFGMVHLQWYVSGTPTTLSAALHLVANTENGCNNWLGNASGSPGWSIYPTVAGWYPVSVSLTFLPGPCGDTLDPYTVSDSIFVVYDDPPVFAMAAPSAICPGDTLALTVVCTGCDSIAWSGPDAASIAGISSDLATVLVTEPGDFLATGFHVTAGSTCYGYRLFTIAPPAPPPLFVDPPSGLICPNDAGHIHTSLPGSGFIWYGADGPLPDDTSSVSVPVGSYYLTMLDTSGCELTNGPITLGAYGTPYMSALSDADTICPGQPVTLQVFASSDAQVLWQPPLMGGGTQMIVSQPGHYSCTIVSCGLSTTANIQIANGAVNTAAMDTGPFTLCGADTLILHGPFGGTNYTWLPYGDTGEDLPVTQQATYQVVVTSGFGCIDTSAYIDVVAQQFTDPLSTDDAHACEGAALSLTATGSGDLSWYADADTLVLLAEGGTYMMPVANSDVTVYVVQREAGCSTDPYPVHVHVTVVPGALVEGDTTLCSGDTLVLSAHVPPGASVSWTTPQGDQLQEAFIQLPPDEVGAGGIYAITVELDGCTGESTDVTVEVRSCDTLVVADTTFIVPTVFTPNGDGNNDVFELHSPSHEPLEVEIINRWGQTVLIATGTIIRWDGRNGLSGEVLAAGVYYYVVSGSFPDGGSLHKQGPVQLIR